MGRLLVARIRPEWAEQVSEASAQIWHYNRIEAKNVNREVDLRLLGGLTLERFSVERDWSETARAKEYGPVVDLAFAQPNRRTTTDWLIEAALAVDRKLLAEQVEARRSWSHPMANEEIWVFPVSALEIEERVRTVTPA